MSELEKVNPRVGVDVGCSPEKLTSTGRSTIDTGSDSVELGHVLVGTGHELDLHALPSLVGGGIPLNHEGRALIGGAGGEGGHAGCCGRRG